MTVVVALIPIPNMEVNTLSYRNPVQLLLRLNDEKSETIGKTSQYTVQPIQILLFTLTNINFGILIQKTKNTPSGYSQLNLQKRYKVCQKKIQ